MSQNRNYKNYFRSPTTEGGFNFPRRTSHRAIGKNAASKQLFFPLNNPSTSTDANLTQVPNKHHEEPGFEQNNQSSDDDSDFDSDHENQTPKDSTYSPIFVDAKISSMESSLMIMGYAMRHKLSSSATTDLLSLINFHLPNEIKLPTSMFLLQKSLGLDFTLAKKHFICEDCGSAIAVMDGGTCAKCKKKYSSTYLLKKERYFFTLDIRSSIQSLLQNEEVKQSLQKSLTRRKLEVLSSITDIMDGSAYRKLKLSEADISCCFNSDGVSIFNSSRFSIWPLLLSINELDYKLRRKNTLLVGLWFGDGKPDFDVFLEPFIQECKSLSQDGVNWSHLGANYISKIFFPIFAADSVARCQIQGINQFNGEYSCPWCLAKGETLWIDERRHKWVFPPAERKVERTNTQFISHLKELQLALQTSKNVSSVFGVKSASKLILLPKFDIVDGFVFDYMHTCLLGIVRTFTCAWLDSKYHDKNFYIGRKSAEIDSRIRNCKLPIECQRTLRETKDVKYWKAHEWKVWMIIAVPLLKGILSDCYLKHFSKFATSICILLQNVIEVEDLAVASKLIKKFCNHIPDLYGLSFCTFNVHLVSHVVDCVKKWGPLWAYSLFQFENYIGILGNSYSGTTFVGLQIAKKVHTAQKLGSLGQTSFKNAIAKDFFLSLSDRKKFYAKSYKVGSCTLLGSRKQYEFSSREKKQLAKLDINLNNGFCYNMCILYKKMYSVCYRDTSQRVNSLIKINSSIYIAQRFVTVQDFEKVIVFVKRLTTIEHPLLSFAYKVTQMSDTVKAVLVDSIENVKFMAIYDINGKLDVVIPLPNTIECE